MSATTVKDAAELAIARAVLAHRAERAAHAAGYTHARIRPLRSSSRDAAQPTRHVRLGGEVLRVR